MSAPSSRSAVDSDGLDAHASFARLQSSPTMSVRQAAELLGIGRNTCYEAIRRGEIPSLRFGSRVVVPTAPLLRLLGVTT